MAAYVPPKYRVFVEMQRRLEEYPLIVNLLKEEEGIPGISNQGRGDDTTILSFLDLHDPPQMDNTWVVIRLSRSSTLSRTLHLAATEVRGIYISHVPEVPGDGVRGEL